MKFLIAVGIAVILFAAGIVTLSISSISIAAASKNKAGATAPSSPAVVPPNVKPTANNPAQVIMLRPDTAGITPLGPGTVATTPSVNIAADQLLPPLHNFFFQPGANLNALVVNNGPAAVYKIKVSVNAALTTVNYLRLYNAGTGFAGCGSATNLVYEAAISTSSGLSDDWPSGMAGFTTGIAICVTGGYTTADATNATTGAMNVNIGWH